MTVPTVLTVLRDECSRVGVIVLYRCPMPTDLPSAPPDRPQRASTMLILTYYDVRLWWTRLCIRVLDRLFPR